MNKVKYLSYYLCDVASRKNRIAKMLLKKQIEVTSNEDTNEYIKAAVLRDEPFSLIRPGLVEIDDYCYYDEIKYWPPYGIRKRNRRIRNTFSSNEDYEKYEHELRKRLLDVDAICGFKTFRYKYFRDEYFSHKPFLTERALCPIGFEMPWTKALSGKRVLIVSVFSNMIQKQFSNIDKVFPDDNPWPDMELLTVQAVWFGSYENRDKRFGSYFEALDYLFNDEVPDGVK